MRYLHAVVKAIDNSGSWTAVANAPVVDRDGERILPKALTWRTPTVPVHAGHSFKVEQLVGRARPYYETNGVLMVDGKFGTSDLAQATRAQVVDGTLTDMSIVFVDAKRSRGQDGVPEITSGELVAVDWVTIGSNPAAHVLAAREAYREVSVADVRRQVDATLLELARLDMEEAQRALRPNRTAARAEVSRLLKGL